MTVLVIKFARLQARLSKLLNRYNGTLEKKVCLKEESQELVTKRQIIRNAYDPQTK